MVTWGVKNVRVPQITSPCSLAGTAVTCSVPAVATRGSQCQASSCLSPVVSVRPATAISSMAQLPWSWRSPLQPAPTEVQRTRTDGSRAELQVADAEALLKSTGAKECPTNFVSAAALWVWVYVWKRSWVACWWDGTAHKGMKLDILVPWTRQAEDIVSLYLLKSPGGLWSVKDSPEDPEKKIIKVSHLLAWSMDSSLQGVLTSWQSRDCPSASQCLSERLKEHFIQITRGDGSHIPSLPMVPTIQQNLLWFDFIWDFCCQLVCRSCYQFSIFLCNLLML